MATSTIFCAKCQAQTENTITLDQDKEIIFTCNVCQGFIKLPAGTTPEDAKFLLTQHEIHNKGQVTMASLETAAQAFADGIKDSELELEN